MAGVLHAKGIKGRGAVILYYSDPDMAVHLLSFEHRRDSGEPVLMLLAEGDSWFSIGGATSNLLMALDDDDTLIVSCASSGDTMRNMSQIGRGSMQAMLHSRYGVKWDAVLLSAGGNDLLDDVSLLIEGGNLSDELLGITLDGIYLGYQRIVWAVREHHSCPIHAHTYDYPVSDLGGWLRSGPWVGNRLMSAGVPQHRHADIIARIIDGLAETLARVDALTLHDTRGTLAPEKWRLIGWQTDWRNEIHPSVAGYRKLAVAWGSIRGVG